MFPFLFLHLLDVGLSLGLRVGRVLCTLAKAGEFLGDQLNVIYQVLLDFLEIGLSLGHLATGHQRFPVSTECFVQIDCANLECFLRMGCTGDGDKREGQHGQARMNHGCNFFHFKQF